MVMKSLSILYIKLVSNNQIPNHHYISFQFDTNKNILKTQILSQRQWEKQYFH